MAEEFLEPGQFGQKSQKVHTDNSIELNIYLWLSRYINWLTVFPRIIAKSIISFFSVGSLKNETNKSTLKVLAGLIHEWGMDNHRCFLVKPSMFSGARVDKIRANLKPTFPVMDWNSTLKTESCVQFLTRAFSFLFWRRVVFAKSAHCLQYQSGWWGDKCLQKTS